MKFLFALFYVFVLICIIYKLKILKMINLKTIRIIFQLVLNEEY